MDQRTDIERFMQQASRQIETSISIVRGLLILLVFLRLLLIRWSEFGDGHIKHIIAIGSLIVGFALSGFIGVQIRRVRQTSPWLIASALLDVMLTLIVVSPSVIWPHDNYLGVLRAPEFGVWVLVVLAAGVRLSKGTALAGLLATLVAVSTLIGWDYAYNVERVTYKNGDAIMAYAVLISAGILGYRLAVWVRSLVLSTATSAGNAARARQVLGAYVSEEVALMIQDEPAKLGGEAREVAVLFSDLRGFTTYSVDTEPGALIAELNEYFETMVRVIRQHGGVVDKYIGDAIMVVYGIPKQLGDEATRAVRTAAGMQSALTELNKTRAKRGLPPLRQGIGIHYGTAVAGNVGTLERLQYTVVGDTVNYASRLEAATKELGVEVLLSEEIGRAHV